MATVNRRALVVRFLFIIDLLKDFCAGGALAVKDGDAVVAPVNNLIDWAIKNDAQIIVLREWHPEDSTHFKKWPKHGVANTRGAEVHDDLALEETNVAHFYKGIGKEEDGYSGWGGRLNVCGESLEQFVRSRILRMTNQYSGQYDEVIISIYHCGLATEYCDKSTFLGSIEFAHRYIGEKLQNITFRCYLVKDAVRAVNQEDGDQAIEDMHAVGGIITTSKEVINE